jgi:hypothetical protein
MRADRVLALDQHDACRRVRAEQLAGYGQADNPGSYDGQPSHFASLDT